MTIYLPTDEEAAEGIGLWNDAPRISDPNIPAQAAVHNELDGQALAAFELDRIARANEHYLSAQLAHRDSPYALLSGSVGATKIASATVNRGAW